MSLMTTPHWEQLDFPVSLRPVRTETPEGEVLDIPGTRCVFREDSEKVLDIVSTRYKLVPHGKIFRELHSLIEELPLQLQGVTTSVGVDGGYARVEWSFNETVQVGPDDDVQISLLAKNSLDRSARIRLELAASRLICANGLRGPGPHFRRSWKHRRSLDLDQVFQVMGSLLERAPQMAEMWQEWRARQIFPQTLEKFLKEDSGARGIIGQRAREGMMNRLLRHRGEASTVSLWEAYNILTEYATHRVRTRRRDLHALRQEEIHKIAVRFASKVSSN